MWLFRRDRQKIDDELLARNIPVLMAVSFFQVFLIIIPIAVPFFQSKGLGMGQVFQLQALFAAVVVLLEVPSGYVADRFGRRQTLVLGSVMLGIGHTCLLGADGFAGLAAFEIFLGIGVSLISGADVALLYDTQIALERDEDTQQRSLGRLHLTHAVSEALAAVLCSVLLIYAHIEAVVWFQVIVGWLPLCMVLYLVEPPVARGSAVGTAAAEGGKQVVEFGAIFRTLLLGDDVLRLSFLVLGLWSLSTFYAVWLLQKYWETGGIELIWFGYLWAACNVVLGIAGNSAQWLEKRFGAPLLLVVVGVLPVIAYAVMASAPLLAGLLAGGLFFVARGVGMVVLRHAFNRRLPGHFRATANSLASFLFRGSFVITGPWVGYALDLWGMETALWILAAGALVLFVTLILPLVVVVRRLTEPEQACDSEGQAVALPVNQEGDAKPA